MRGRRNIQQNNERKRGRGITHYRKANKLIGWKHGREPRESRTMMVERIILVASRGTYSDEQKRKMEEVRDKPPARERGTWRMGGNTLDDE